MKYFSAFLIILMFIAGTGINRADHINLNKIITSWLDSVLNGIKHVFIFIDDWLEKPLGISFSSIFQFIFNIFIGIVIWIANLFISAIRWIIGVVSS